MTKPELKGFLTAIEWSLQGFIPTNKYDKADYSYVIDKLHDWKMRISEEIKQNE